MKQKKFDLRRCLSRLHDLQVFDDIDGFDGFNHVYAVAIRHSITIIEECVVDASGSDGTLLDIGAYGD